MRYLTVDFGSTYTKLAAVDAGEARLLGVASAFTTIATDVTLGLNAGLESLSERIGRFEYDELLCCSSAGGGLKMVALGLVPELTAKAAKMAAESAGAKVIRTYAYEISEAEQAEIAAVGPDIVLLCGGTDGGNRDVIVKNAALICETPGSLAIIAAGNKSASRELEDIFKASGKAYVITKNVMPTFGRLDTEPARNAIRDIFIERIIDAKGLAEVQRMTKHEILPTPLAVLKGCELLSLGTQKTPGIGEFLAVDVGGATTD
ncbi:MAG: glutamate mutase L, partial [Deltaproteobacteria bacterium]|nr:glutamate mutase L [Deltaproteobacteria bacterium]